jgi:hypothetical protein
MQCECLGRQRKRGFSALKDRREDPYSSARRIT